MGAPQPDGFINNVHEDEIISALSLMETNSSYVTKPAYKGNVEKWPDHQISFIEFHITYLKAHPLLDPGHYISNLKLMLKRQH